jgi:ribosomal protein S6--L-glutamate ligase
MQFWVLTDRRYLRQRMPRALADWLESQGHRVRVVSADSGSLVSALGAEDGSSAWAGLASDDLVVIRSRHPFALALLKQAESLGARTFGSWAAVQHVRNKVRAVLTLKKSRLPTPETFLAHTPEDLARVPSSHFPLVLKPFQGDNAEGILLVRSPEELSMVEWSDAIVLAQPFLDVGGVDLKLYAVGETVWAVRRPSPLTNGNGRPVRVGVDSTLRRLALDCAAAFRLQLLGVDVLESGDGPLIVDVNEFPNYTGIEEAPSVIGRLLLEGAPCAP